MRKRLWVACYESALLLLVGPGFFVQCFRIIDLETSSPGYGVSWVRCERPAYPQAPVVVKEGSPLGCIREQILKKASLLAL